jgi:hypothetical protein
MLRVVAARRAAIGLEQTPELPDDFGVRVTGRSSRGSGCVALADYQTSRPATGPDRISTWRFRFLTFGNS